MYKRIIVIFYINLPPSIPMSVTSIYYNETFLSVILANYFLIITLSKGDQHIWSSVLLTLLDGHTI